MYQRLTKIDDLTRPDHSFLTEEDSCFYLGEYTARGGYAASITNDLINNLKKPMLRRQNPAEWKWKERAIETAAAELRRIIGADSIVRHTFIPTPPSKIKTHPEYDDRLVQILTKMGVGLDIDVREIVYQANNMDASHEGERASIDDLVENYRLNPVLQHPLRNNDIVIVDDMLTTGRHFRAMSVVLRDIYPDATIKGLFIARRAPKTITPDELKAIFGSAV